MRIWPFSAKARSEKTKIRGAGPTVDKVVAGLSLLGLTAWGILYYANIVNGSITAYGPITEHLARFDMLRQRYFFVAAALGALMAGSLAYAWFRQRWVGRGRRLNGGEPLTRREKNKARYTVGL